MGAKKGSRIDSVFLALPRPTPVLSYIAVKIVPTGCGNGESYPHSREVPVLPLSLGSGRCSSKQCRCCCVRTYERCTVNCENVLKPEAAKHKCFIFETTADWYMVSNHSGCSGSKRRLLSYLRGGYYFQHPAVQQTILFACYIPQGQHRYIRRAVVRPQAEHQHQPPAGEGFRRRREC